ncbi:MAG: hypothetical protein ACYDCQ_22505 [Dehalococcoidia bacterium]
MDRTRMTGALIMAGSIVQLLVFSIGFARRSYLAIALPITLALAGISALGIWVGWTMMTTESDVPEPDDIEQPASS